MCETQGSSILACGRRHKTDAFISFFLEMPVAKNKYKSYKSKIFTSRVNQQYCNIFSIYSVGNSGRFDDI